MPTISCRSVWVADFTAAMFPDGAALRLPGLPPANARPGKFSSHVEAMQMTAQIIPPSIFEMANAKVKAAENAWDIRNPGRVTFAHAEEIEWESHRFFTRGREEIKSHSQKEWAPETGYKLKIMLWAFSENRIAVRFEYEWFDESGRCWRSDCHGLWEFDADGLVCKGFASIHDVPIIEAERVL